MAAITSAVLIAEYGYDVSTAEGVRAYARATSAVPRPIMSAAEYAWILRRMLGRPREDARLMAPFWREVPMAPSVLAPRYAEWLAYYQEAVPRPETVGSRYNDPPAQVAWAWRLGIPSRAYPRGWGHLLPPRGWVGGRERIRALIKLSRRSHEAGAPESAKTADLRRLARLSGAFLRAAQGSGAGLWAGDGSVVWETVASLHTRWLALGARARARLQCAHVPASEWLVPGILGAMRRGFKGYSGWEWIGESLSRARRDRAAQGFDPLAPGGAAYQARAATLRARLPARVEAAILRPDVRRWALGTPCPRPKLPEEVLRRATVLLRKEQRQTANARRFAQGVDRYELGEALRRCRAVKDARVRARAAARAARRAALRAADGALVGWRCWEVSGDLLISPTQHTKWPSATLVAEGISRGTAVRNKEGIHASWDRRGDYARSYLHSPVIGRVRGYGAYAAGPEGWRAERVTIDRLLVIGDGSSAEDSARQLSARYGVPVGVLRMRPRPRA